MVLLGVILVLGILMWNVDSQLEWNIPLKWQAVIREWREGLGSRVLSLNYVCYSDPKECELEKYFWRIQKELPKLRTKFNGPLWIKVYVHQDLETGKDDKYLSCLQRRFPEMEIHVDPLCGEVRDTYFLPTGNEHQESSGMYALFPDIK